ncbi:DUF3999 family protein [Ferruginibacter sp. HRS2-29]|uniref:DUF3999 family protein n=1 Tax=Ferruginibacter sp. HRS2-29 TaxID=2487334 RepID=UPI0020CF1861|nr:DUF3999 family protein [Ferruginibacter sp. HRS2-29]MCP9752105.1 DUF3999 family protein [Ferruginibacter sp. HRS2-29]
MKKKWFNVLCCSLLAMSGKAQVEGYKYYMQLDTVSKPGYYNIALSPEITGRIKTDYSDVRIVYNAHWVPYVLNTEKELLREAYLRDLKFSIPESNRQHTVVLATANDFDKTTLNLLLTIRNTAAERACSVSGSDDLKNWFVLNDSTWLSPFPGPQQTIREIRIPLPASSYKYFKVVIHNNNRDPFDIMKVATAVADDGNDNKIQQYTRVIQNPPVRMTQTDSGNISYITVRQSQSYHFDRISYQISGTKYFNRKAAVYLSGDDVPSIGNPGRLYALFTIADNSCFNTKLPVANSKTFFILVYNEDNPPLRFSELSTSLNQRFITAYLESNKLYQLIFGNSDATLPAFDLKVADSNRVNELPFVKTGSLVTVRSVKPDAPKHTPANYKWLLWTAIGLVLLALFFFSLRRFREIGKNKTT